MNNTTAISIIRLIREARAHLAPEMRKAKKSNPKAFSAMDEADRLLDIAIRRAEEHLPSR